MIIVLKGKILTGEVWMNGEKLSLAKSLKVAKHSPTGFSWGYTGSGPAQLALAICQKLYNQYGKKASFHYHQFKDDHIAILPQTDFEAIIVVTKSYLPVPIK